MRPPGRHPETRRIFLWLLIAVASLALGGAWQPASAQSLQDKITQCAACHGEDGRSKDPKIPHIGGQPKLAVMYQLFFYREGRRKSPEMNLIAKDLTDAELTAIAEHVSKLPPFPPLPGPIDEARFKRAAELADKRHCASCAGFSDASMTPHPHAPRGGVREAPRHEIAGSRAATVQRALWGFSRREGHGGG